MKPPLIPSPQFAPRQAAWYIWRPYHGTPSIIGCTIIGCIIARVEATPVGLTCYTSDNVMLPNNLHHSFTAARAALEAETVSKTP